MWNPTITVILLSRCLCRQYQCFWVWVGFMKWTTSYQWPAETHLSTLSKEEGGHPSTRFPLGHSHVACSRWTNRSCLGAWITLSPATLQRYSCVLICFNLLCIITCIYMYVGGSLTFNSSCLCLRLIHVHTWQPYSPGYNYSMIGSIIKGISTAEALGIMLTI